MRRRRVYLYGRSSADKFSLLPGGDQMDEAKVLKMREIRCSVCRMNDQELLELHRDRFENGLTFEVLVRKYGRPERNLSESGIRRHMRRHAAEPEDSPISEVVDTSEERATAGADRGAGFDGEALLATGTKNLAGVIDRLTQEIHAHPQAAGRLFDKLFKAQGLLARSVKQVDEARALREEFRKTIKPIIDRITSEAIRSIASVMRENGKKVRDNFMEVANERMTVDEFWSRLSTAENEWPKEVGTRMRTATDEALKTDEARCAN